MKIRLKKFFLIVGVQILFCFLIISLFEFLRIYPLVYPKASTILGTIETLMTLLFFSFTVPIILFVLNGFSYLYSGNITKIVFENNYSETNKILIHLCLISINVFVYFLIIYNVFPIFINDFFKIIIAVVLTEIVLIKKIN
ncbi:hypothetical protein EDL99_06555 [Ornithobacterium rhinotracheale]|nr:hypothetical protein [Ornithobacterium rhinotracheale]